MMLYKILQLISMLLYTIVSAIWYIEESLISFMMYCFLGGLKIACHPLVLVPLVCGGAYGIRLILAQRQQEGNAAEVPTHNKNRMIMDVNAVSAAAGEKGDASIENVRQRAKVKVGGGLDPFESGVSDISTPHVMRPTRTTNTNSPRTSTRTSINSYTQASRSTGATQRLSLSPRATSTPLAQILRREKRYGSGANLFARDTAFNKYN